MMLKNDITIDEANKLLFAVAAVLAAPNNTTFHDMMQEVRYNGEPKQIVEKVFEAIFRPGVVYPDLET